jgi:hypothetical protein
MGMAAGAIQDSAVPPSPADDIAVLTDACATSHVVASALGHSSPAVTHARTTSTARPPGAQAQTP